MFLIEQDLKFGEMSPLRISEDLSLRKSQSIHPGGLKLSEEHIKFDLNISQKYKKYINTKLSFKLKKNKKKTFLYNLCRAANDPFRQEFYIQWR